MHELSATPSAVSGLSVLVSFSIVEKFFHCFGLVKQCAAFSQCVYCDLYFTKIPHLFFRAVEFRRTFESLLVQYLVQTAF